MSLHFSLGAWEVKGSGAVWISDDHHRALMERARRDGLQLLLRIGNPRADSAYASYELGALAREIEGLLAEPGLDTPLRGASALLPSPLDMRALLTQLRVAVQRAQEWQTDIVVRSD
jgi:hypothetical protein